MYNYICTKESKKQMVSAPLLLYHLHSSYNAIKTKSALNLRDTNPHTVFTTNKNLHLSHKPIPMNLKIEE